MNRSLSSANFCDAGVAAALAVESASRGVVGSSGISISAPSVAHTNVAVPSDMVSPDSVSPRASVHSRDA